MLNEQMGLFSENESQPMASRVRPRNLDDFVGQEAIFRRVNNLDLKKLPHIIFYGPPGCGKTTLAIIIAKQVDYEFSPFNAVLGGVAELRSIIKDTQGLKASTGKKSIIFIDEIHRFNKAQQDALLPYLENGDFVLFGATTENPNTSLNKAVLSRVQRWRMEALSEVNIEELLQNITSSEKQKIHQELLKYLAMHSNGDARFALNQLEVLIQNAASIQGLSCEEIAQAYLFDNRRYDKDNERHYDVISAFIKSVRGSDADAAIMWLAVMLDGSEDCEFIARRLIILASEDIGNADPRALQMATSTHYAIKNIGMPEARIILAQATTYLANAPKSNSSYIAIDAALSFVKDNPTIEVPTHLRNHHPDKKNYKAPHSFKNHWVRQDYKKVPEVFFKSSEIAYEKMQSDYLKRIKK